MELTLADTTAADFNIRAAIVQSANYTPAIDTRRQLIACFGKYNMVLLHVKLSIELGNAGSQVQATVVCV